VLRISEELLLFAEKYGRMPSVSELHENGRNDLACAISRNGGFRSWAERLGLGLKGTETHRALAIEDEEQVRLERLGFRVYRQTTKAPFDLLVNGQRVDVKSGRPSIYGKDKNKYVGWVFNLIKVPPTCDFYLLVCQSRDGAVERRYVVPASEAQITTITITPSGKYERYRDADHLLKG
jgi:hypothetical protein